eukprot:7455151-Karenia_brevis.AAC.1
MDFARVLRPFPEDILPFLLSAHHALPSDSRAAAVVAAWNGDGKKPCTVEDIEVLYEKLEVVLPRLLQKINIDNK